MAYILPVIRNSTEHMGEISSVVLSPPKNVEGLTFEEARYRLMELIAREGGVFPVYQTVKTDGS